MCACSGQLYLLHIEVTNLLLVLASTQLYSTAASAPVGAHPFVDSIMEQAGLAPQLVQCVLQHFIARPRLPSNVQLWAPSQDAAHGVLQIVRSAAGVSSICAQPHTASLPDFYPGTLIKFQMRCEVIQSKHDIAPLSASLQEYM